MKHFKQVFIEQNIPIPFPPKAKWPLEHLKLGDSFLMSGLTETRRVGNLHVRARRLGIEITTRKTRDGIRVWRVK